MTKIDTSTEAVERLLDGVTPGPWELRHNMAEDEVGEYAEGVSVVANGRFYVHEHDLCFGDDVDALIEANARFIAAARDLVPALLKERDEAVDAKLDALSTLDAWFDRRKLGNEAVNQAVIDAASGYLRTSRVGGMPQVESDLILGVMQDMSRLGLFADIFARAMNDLVPALLKERDHMRAALAASQTADPVTNAGCCQSVKIKPLVWEDFGDCGAKASAYYQANYLIQFWKGREQFEVALSYPGYQTGYDGDRWHPTIDAAKAAAQADYEARIRASIEPAPHVNETPQSEHDSADVLATLPAAVAPSLRITGPNSDGEYWLHIKAGGRSGGVNLGGEHGPICKRLLDAASEIGAKE